MFVCGVYFFGDENMIWIKFRELKKKVWVRTSSFGVVQLPFEVRPFDHTIINQKHGKYRSNDPPQDTVRGHVSQKQTPDDKHEDRNDKSVKRINDEPVGKHFFLLLNASKKKELICTHTGIRTRV